MAKVTLQSIADRVGVSRMTVSNAFSRPDQLSAELRERILAAADELGYVGPDPAARALARGRTGSVGLLLTDELSEAFQDAVATEFLTSVADALNQEGLAITLLTSGAPGGPYIPARDVAMDGAIVYICDPASPDIEWLERRGLPLVSVDRDPSPTAPSVTVADRDGARAAAQHVVDLGHRSVGVITLETGFDGEGKPTANRPARERLLGWRDALTPAGVEPEVRAARFRPDLAVEDVARELLDRPDRPTAVLCFSDAFAVATMRVAESLGLRVPEDLSVVGYDDSPLATAVRPQLTTVHQEVSSKGREAVRTLLGRMRGTDATEPERVLLPTSLVVRESTAPPAG
ncbi:MAG TPA: LacI family DNA-binding transcriptional regulator [Nocardioides sp.]|nr:LacI family DNA-binding transcriptional regulator [Nocardioides sp.]